MTLDNANVFDHLNKIITDCLTVLRSQRDLLRAKNVYSKQRRIDVQQGFVRFEGGLLVYLKDIQHRIIFDGFEIQSIDTFVELCEEVLKYTDTPLSQFALRTLIEISFDKFKILFDDKLSLEEKNKYKAICLLADYGFMTNPSHTNEYNKLFIEFSPVFSTKQKKLLEDLHIAATQGLEKQTLVRKTRKLIGAVQDILSKKIDILPLFNLSKIESMDSALSHILHGDFILISSLFLPLRKKSNKLRTYYTLMIVVVNAINCVGAMVKDVELHKQIDSINDEFKAIGTYIKQHWEEIEK